MNPTFDAFVRSWPFDPWLVFYLLLTGSIYLRGWLTLHRHSPRRWHRGQPIAFAGGLIVIFLALASPLEPFAALLLQVHMLQHLLLMMVAPPLLWLGAPFFPLLRGLPRPIRILWLAPFLRWIFVRRLFQRLTHPVPAWLLFTAATVVWHLPPVYERALNSDAWHYCQHVCFITTALLFWYPVIRPYPSRPLWSPWLLIPYLILADLQNTLLAAVLTFSDQPLYSYYVQRPRLGNLSPLEDQVAAGVLMWVPGSLTFLVPVFFIGVGLLFGSSRRSVSGGGVRACEEMGTGSGQTAGNIEIFKTRPVPVPISSQVLSGEWSDEAYDHSPDLLRERGRLALPLVSEERNVGKNSCTPGACPTRLASTPTHHSPVTAHSGLDVLRLPLLGRFLRWKHARLSLQVPLMLLAGVIIYDGLGGPQIGAMNLAGVLPWIHWRGFVILGLLVLGNIFCMACPFTVPRTLARRWLPQGRIWPRWLRSKWIAVALLVLFLWAYEASSLWDNPWWTAWIVVGYFAAAFVVDGFFRGAAFCKYLCPIGQFNFVQSLLSPLEIKARDPQVCAGCQTKDCIRGRDGIPGCALNLFLPRKSSNMDCTFCLDCIHACPHDNVGILAQPPGTTLWHDSFRSGLGRFAKRPDLAALIVVLTFGAFANAAGMVAPVLQFRDQLASRSGVSGLPGPAWPSPILVTSFLYLCTLFVLPALMIGMSAVLSRWLGQLKESWPQVAIRFAFSLVPLGFGMWLAHYSFHFLASFDSVIRAMQRLAGDLGLALGEPDWRYACCRPVADWLPRLEILFLDGGLLFSLYSAYRIALTQCHRRSQALKAFAPWGMLMALLFAAGVWIVLQPMQMRGTLFPAG
jgi:cytochrome c oxidase assembly factor CtaG/polyferredoxin